MPWSVNDPPNVAKNWPVGDRRKCVAAANAVLRDGGSDEDAIFACISAAGRGREMAMDKQWRDQVLVEAAVEAVADDKKGIEWEVVIIGQDEKRPESLVTADGREYIRSLNGRLFSVEGLQAAVGLFDKAKVYDNHQTDEQYEATKGMRSPKNEWLGTIVRTWWDKKRRQVRGIFKVVETQLADKLKNAHDAGVLDSIGLSIDYGYKLGRDVTIEGQRLPVVESIVRVSSVDLVGNAAAGGGFARMLAAHNEAQGADDMDENEVKELVKATLEETLPDLVSSSVAAALTAQEAEDEVDEEATDATEADAEEEEEEEAEEEDAEEEEEETEETEVPNPDSDALEAVRALESTLMVKDKLASAKLPPAFARLVEARFPRGQVYQEKEVDKMIKQAREAWKSADASGQVKGTGNSATIRSGMTGKEWAEVEFMRLVMGNTNFRAVESIAGQEDKDYVDDRVPAAYWSWLKAGRPKGNTRRLSNWVYEMLDGDPFASSRAYESVTTSGMTSIVKNALNLMLAVNYSVRELWWDPIVTTEEVDTIDQATLVRLYGMNTLSVVGEGDPYTELDWADDEETASFVKKGNYIGVTLETLLRDKVQAVRMIPNRLADAWYNTLSALNSAVFTVNSAAGPVLSDTGALFNATAVSSAGGHANLLTTALSHTAFLAARLAMMKQTAQQSGAGRRLQVRPRYILVPNDLWAQATYIRNSDLVPEADGSSTTGNQTTNVLQGQFDVIEVPDWTDVTDWALVGDKATFPAIFNIFLRGLRVPELFTADSDVAGAMFTNDQIRYKVRLMTWRFSDTYDCAPVADFRPLHKSNVAG